MRRSLISLAAVAAVCAPGLAHAGVYTDEMSKCLVRSATPQDQSDLVVWVFSAMSAHPSVKTYASVTEPQRIEITRKASGLMERLLVVSCRKETVEALKYEGSSAIEQSFGVLGQVAMRGLMSDPSVAQNLATLSEYVDASKFEALAKEAGIVEPKKPASK
jgi:hypothetical protein